MQQVSELLGVVAWPAVVLVGLILFRRPLREVLSRDDLSVSGPGGISFSARRAVDAMVDADEAKNRGATNGARGSLSAAEAEDQVREVVEFVRRLGRSPRILWVDDLPSNNRHERWALESMGMTVYLSTSTADAQRKLHRRGDYDVVISDMARPEDPRAGYVLLRWMQDRGDGTPFVVYSSSNEPAHYDEAVSNGAVGSTARPQELIDMVLRALRDARPRPRWRPAASAGHIWRR
jgi:CheY-like chemotaxis protein